MRHITDLEEFLSLQEITKHSNWIPDKKKGWSLPIVRYTDWSEIYRENGFDFILALAKLSKSDTFYFYALDRYLGARRLAEAKSFPIIEFSTNSTADEIRNALHTTPAETALAYCTEFMIFSKSQDWYVYSQYEIELSKVVSYVNFPTWTHEDPFFISEEEAMKNIRHLFPQKALINP